MCAGRGPERCGNSKKLDDPIEFTVSPMKGEPSRFAFVSPGIKIGTVIVADPIEAKDKGCTIRLLRLTRAFDLAFMSGVGFVPNSDVHFTVSSEISSDRVIRADSAGTIRATLAPFTAKKKEGTAKIKINEAAWSPEASWVWGPI